MPNNKKNKKKGVKQNTSRDISNWVETGRVDAKGLSKKLPGVAEAIREGSLKPSEVPKLLDKAKTDCLVEDLVKCFSEHLPSKNITKGVKCTGKDSIQLAFPFSEPLLTDLTKVACGYNDALRFEFATEFLGKAAKLLEGYASFKNFEDIVIEMEENPTIMTQQTRILLFCMQKRFDEICEKHKASIEQYTKRPLKETCDAYGLPLEEFVKKCYSLIHRRQNYTLEQLAQEFTRSRIIQEDLDKKVEASARGVEAGWDNQRKVCWECGQIGSRVAKCSLCHAARYCSTACQREAWKSGHRDACSSLKIKYQRFTENYRRIDQAMALQDEKHHNPMYEGCTLAPAGANDYAMIPFMLRMKETFVIQPCLCDDTSIDHMYKSLADIANGHKHWMFDDVLTGTLQDLHLDTTFSERQADDTEMAYMHSGLLFLGNDLSKVTPPCAVGEWVHAMRDHLRQTYKHGDSLMPVRRFVEIYHHFGLAADQREEGYGYYDESSSTVRLMKLAEGLFTMMHFAHKSTDDASFCMDEFQRIMETFHSR